MGFYPPATLVRDAQRHGVEVLPVDVNLSGARCVVEWEAVRIGLNYISSIGKDDAEALVAERDANGPYATSPTSPAGRSSPTTGSRRS